MFPDGSLSKHPGIFRPPGKLSSFNSLAILFCVGFFFCTIRPVFGQEETKQFSAWINGGLGLSIAGAGHVTDLGGGLSGRLGLAIETYRIVPSVRLTANMGGVSSFESLIGGNLKDEYFDIGGLIGYNLSAKPGIRLIPSIGISKVSGRRVVAAYGGFWGDGSREEFNPVIGLPVELAIVGGHEWIGFGLYLHANLNSVENFYGITLNVVAGKLSQ